ncbi:hypothetical protein JCM33374_g1930 [Metschnikowia sp. JCM 33374]|nr:hypothetical protein JCM33374_g1930 [Metschnikowia sp. JCM 33374]
MADLLETYESDFQLAMQEARSKIASVGREPAHRSSALKAIEHASDEAVEILDQMNIEVQNLPASSRSAQNTRIRQHRADVEEVKQKLRQLVDAEDRSALFGSRYTDNDDEESSVGLGHESQRKQLLSNNASLERSSNRLTESQRIAFETENIGGNILNDLRAQREQIVNSRNTLSAADNYVDKSVQTLKSMSRRITANKFISYAIIAVLILLIMLVLANGYLCMETNPWSLVIAQAQETRRRNHYDAQYWLFYTCKKAGYTVPDHRNTPIDGVPYIQAG